MTQVADTKDISGYRAGKRSFRWSHSIIKENEAGYEGDSTEKETIHNLHDRGYKYLLSSKKIFLELLRSFVQHGWIDQIDESDVVRMDKSYILPDFSEKEADLVYRLTFKDRDVIFYLLNELQSTVDYLMPYRLLLYKVEIWRD